MKNTLEEIKVELYNLINKESNIQSEKVSKSEYDDRYWRSFGRTVAFAKSITLIEDKQKVLKDSFN